VDGTGSGFCSVMGFGISRAEPSSPTSTDLVTIQCLVNTYLNFATVSIYLQHLCMNLERVIHAKGFFKNSVLTFLHKKTTRNEKKVIQFIILRAYVGF
jgi:hypothetical protein